MKMKFNFFLMAAVIFVNVAMPMKRGREYGEDMFDEYWEPVQQSDLDKALLIDSDYCGCQLASLLDQGADIDARDKQRRTPILRAVARNFINNVELLIARGANIELRCDFGYTPLGLAAFKDYIEIAELLLMHGADVYAKDARGYTPLHQAIKNQRSDALVHMLLTWIPVETIRISMRNRNRSIQALIHSKRLELQLALPLMPLDVVIAQQHIASLESDQVVMPILNKFGVSALYDAIRANVQKCVDVAQKYPK